MDSGSQFAAPIPGPPARPPIAGLEGDPGPPASPFGEEREPLRQRGPSWLRRKLGAAGAAILALAAKLKAVLLLGQVKLFATAGTMAVSIVAYGSIWGLAFGAGFVALIFVHEMGHVIALRREGIRASVPIFIPFLGAVIGSRSLGDNALAEARVGLAGPVLGSIGAAACVLIWQATGNELWRALAYWGFLLNLFNLIPVVPLDGGRAMAAMAPWMWFAGLAAMAALAFAFPNPVYVLILVVGAYELYRRWEGRRRGGAGTERYYRVAPRNRALVAVTYVGLIALLVLGMHFTFMQRSIV
jgi:Zn-dependent protease